ncbi:MAG: Carboxypeptidase T precursor [candidate division Hyd24-12 bacterium ADurb.Bin004]|nr:MAG: Carboxypeptidase T precursor [candidate division Hyd24-12 bacterium ADurb.Bin004]
MRFLPLLIAILSSVALSGPGTYRSVWITHVSPADLQALQAEGFDIESYRDSRARIYADAQDEMRLEQMGFLPIPDETCFYEAAYPSLAAVNDTLEAIVARHPGICRLENIGSSHGGRPIYAVVVSDNIGQEEVEPEFRLISAIHGDEKASAMVALNFLRNLADNADTSPMCEYIVETAETWVIPILNPDGYVSNSRYNGNSVDLNRNLSYHWQSGGGYGSGPFSEPETRALRDITMKNWPAQTGFENPFCASMSLHGGEACFNYVWNYSSAAVPDTALIVDMANDYAALCQVPGFWVTEGWAWYVITGDVNDWSYGEYGGIDHTIEVHLNKQYSDWPTLAAQHYMALLDFYVNSTYGFWGTVTNSYGNPLDANIQITRRDGSDSEPMRFCRTDITMGDYAKPALPGTYDVTATVAGFAPKTVSNVQLGPSERVEVSFVFDPDGVEGGHSGVLQPLSLTASANPFSASVVLNCTTSLEGRLTIYDITGHSVFAAGIPAGGAAITWNGTTEDGTPMPSGVYIARLTDGSGIVSARLVRQN